MPLWLSRALVSALDRIAPASGRAQHLVTGSSGEDAAHFHLRQLGYIIVARNWRTPLRRGELDLVGWDGDVLCFIEVKTRTSHGLAPAEAAVDFEKQRELRSVAREYLRRCEPRPACRFDIVSIYFAPQRPPEVILFKDAFRLE